MKLIIHDVKSGFHVGSPPVWVAWIEIVLPEYAKIIDNCRHPCGWRGLKSVFELSKTDVAVSPPVWVAWIEIDAKTIVFDEFMPVATRVGGVD